MRHYFSRLQDQIKYNWNKKALADYEGDSFTFGEVAEQIARFHLLFREFGIKKGDKIAICAKNQARWGICFLAVNTYEAVVVPILADFTAESVTGLLRHSESVMIFTDSDIWSKLSEDITSTVKIAIRVSDFTMIYGSEKDRTAMENLDNDFRQQYPDGFSSSDVHYPIDNAKDLAVINYTSGSTGDPKGVMLRYECFSANTQYGQTRIPSFPTDNILSILPMAHMFGMAFELIYPLSGGTTVYYLGKTPSPTRLMQAMQQVKPYLVIAVPMVFEKIYRKKLKVVLDKPVMKLILSVPGIRNFIYAKMRRSLDNAFGGKVRMYILGGAALNPEVESFLHQIKFHFTIGYGMTEAAPLMAYEDWDKFALRSCGKAMDYVKLRIDSDDPSSKPGEIQAKGINLFSGYFKNESATKEAFTSDGWFNTGDLGLIDKDGNLYIKGRRKSMFLSSSGQNVYPEEIESIVNNQPGVIESLVVKRGSKLVGLVLPEEPMTGEQTDALLKAINLQLPGYSKLASVELVKEPFAKTPKQSIKRFLYS